jgi:hypothetical protein
VLGVFQHISGRCARAGTRRLPLTSPRYPHPYRRDEEGRSRQNTSPPGGTSEVRSLRPGRELARARGLLSSLRKVRVGGDAPPAAHVPSVPASYRRDEEGRSRQNTSPPGGTSAAPRRCRHSRVPTAAGRKLARARGLAAFLRKVRARGDAPPAAHVPSAPASLPLRQRGAGDRVKIPPLL